MIHLLDTKKILSKVSFKFAKGMLKRDDTLIHYFDANGLYATILEKKKFPSKLLEKKTYDMPHDDLHEFCAAKVEGLNKKNEHCYFYLIDAEFQTEYLDTQVFTTYHISLENNCKG